MSDHPKIAAMYCVYDDDEWLPCSVESIYSQMDAIYFFVSDSPWNGPRTGNEKTLEAIARLEDPEKKIRIERGDWTDQVKQRNFATAVMMSDGYDYTLLIDADEIYCERQLKAAIDLAYSRPEVDCWHTYTVLFWKSPRYRIDPPDPFQPPVLLRLGTGGFVEYRNPHCKTHELIPPEVCVYFHMSYARSDEQILRKIHACSFAPLVKEGWYEKKWKAWDNNKDLEDLNPYIPESYKRAVPVPIEVLPEVLQRYILSHEDRFSVERGEALNN